MKRIFTIVYVFCTSLLLAQGPGGHSSGLVLWLKANVGINNTTEGGNVYGWSDQSNNATNTWVSNPWIYRGTARNFNPALEGSATTGVGSNDGNINGATTANSIVIAFETSSDVTSRQVLFERGGTNNGIAIYIQNGQLHCNFFVSSVDYAASTPISGSGFHSLVFVYNGGSQRYDCYLNGNLVSSYTGIPSSLPADYNNNGIGGAMNQVQFASNVNASGGNGFLGMMMEFAYYNGTVFTASQRNDILSYLHVKYGKDHVGDLTFSNGSPVFWNAAANAGYINDLAGIARDDQSGLNQKQSKSGNSDALVTIGKGTIAASNIANGNNFSTDESGLVWSNNDASFNGFSPFSAPSGRVILERTWKLQSTGTVGNVMFQVPDNASSSSAKLPAEDHAVYLLLDTDADFSSGTTEVEMNLSGTNWEATTSVAGYSYFTFATQTSSIGAMLYISLHGDESGPTDVELTVELSSDNTTGSAITFDLTDLGTGTATSGNDYLPVPGGAQISVPNGSNVGSYTISVIDDSEIEEFIEKIDFQISNPSDASVVIYKDTATANISENDWVPSPGGEAVDLVFWLKADAGTNTLSDGAAVTSWADQTYNGSDAFNTGVAPTFKEIGNSYNPAIDFSGTGDGMAISDNDGINTSASSMKSFAIVFRTSSDVNTRQLIYEQGGGTHGLNLYIESGHLYANLWVSNADNAASTAIAPNTAYAVIFVYDGIGTRWDLYVNGSLATSSTGVPTSLPAHSGDIGLGAINQSTQYNGNVDAASGDSFSGWIMEMAYYNGKTLSADERASIFSYLCVKYGIAQSSDYVSVGNVPVIWNALVNAGFSNDVSGIGREDSTALHQKQGISASPDALVSIGLGTVTADNASNPNGFAADESFFLWGDDDGGISKFASSGAPAGKAVIERIWKYQSTGSIAGLQVKVPGNSSPESVKLPLHQGNVYLLLDDDGDFSSGSTSVTMAQSGSDWECSFNPSSDVYFSFATDALVADLNVAQHGYESGPKNIIFTVTLSSANNTGSAITFDLDDLGTGSATAGSDYNAISGGAQISVANGALSGTYTVVVNDDANPEGKETLDVKIGNASNDIVELNTGTATADINDDDGPPAPGGLAENLVLWLKADAGTSTTTDGAVIYDWNDQSGNNINCWFTGTAYFTSVVNNFNPAINLTGSGGVGNSGGNINREADQKSAVLVFRTDADVSTRQVLLDIGGTTNGINIYIESEKLYCNLSINNVDYANSTAISGNTAYSLIFNYDGDHNRWDCYLNGTLAISLTSVPGTFPDDYNNNGIGALVGAAQFAGNVNSTAANGFLGYLMEFAFYNYTALNANERRDMFSYLGIKYGISSEADYALSRGGTVYWDQALSGSFTKSIVGIVRDDETELYQKQAKSAAGDALVTMGLSSIVTSNLSNANSIANDQAVLAWGHNNAALTGVTTNAELPAQSGVVDRLRRIWKVKEVNGIGTVQLAFPKAQIDTYLSTFTEGEIYFRVADDSALSVNVVDMTFAESSINGEQSYTVSMDFSGTKYFGIVRKGFIVWTGSEWRGGLNASFDHAPSEEPADTLKPMYILVGDTADLPGPAVVDSTYLDTGSVFEINPLSCLRTKKINSYGSLILSADATGFGQYKGPAVEATVQQFIDNEGWHNLGSPFSDVAWKDITSDDGSNLINYPSGGVSTDSCNSCNLWWYDTSTDNGEDIGFMSSTAYGTWRTAGDSSEAFAPSKGWNMYFTDFFSPAPWRISFTGTLNSGNIGQTVNENNSGWNLVANPYPSVIDWDLVDDDLAADGIGPGYYVWDDENTNYATYSNGSGTLGAERYIAPMQGFYVQTATAGAQGSGDVFHTFNLNDNHRPKDCQTAGGNFFKSQTQVPNEIRLRTRHAESGKIDETLIKFGKGAERMFTAGEDVRKLLTKNVDVASVFGYYDNDLAAINIVPEPYRHDSLFLGILAKDGSAFSVEAAVLPSGVDVYLEDLQTGKWHSLKEPLEFMHDKKLTRRFLLHYSYSTLTPRSWEEANPFSIHIDENGYMVLKTLKRLTDATWYLTGISGKVVAQGLVNHSTGNRQLIDNNQLSPGIYLFVFFEGDEKYAEKLPLVR